MKAHKLIKLEVVLMASSEFKRIANLPDNIPLNLTLQMNNQRSKTHGRLVTELIATVNDKSSPVYATVKFIAQFTISPELREKFESFIESGKNLEILIPYVREELQSRFQKSALPPFVMPMIETDRLLKEMKGKKKEAPVKGKT